jgi:hypothetical protein
LPFVPIEMLGHLKKMPAESESYSGRPWSSDLSIGQVILAGLVDHLEHNGFVL